LPVIIGHATSDLFGGKRGHEGIAGEIRGVLEIVG